MTRVRRNVLLVLAALTASLVGVQPAAARPAGLQSGPHVASALAAASLPTDRLHFGLANQPGDFGWMQSAGVPFRYRYVYLVGGVNTGSGWETYNSPLGAYAAFYMSDSDSIGAIPVFTYYEILQSLPHVGSNELDSDYSNLNNASTMSAYYANFALLMTQAKAFGKTVVVHVEPDLFAYMEQKAAGGDASSVSASVASSGYVGLGGLPNTFQGFIWALLTLRNSIAPNVVLATHASTWASGVDIGLNTDPTLNLSANADTVAAFLNSAGIAANPTGTTIDTVFTDVADRDSGTPSGRWWDRNNLVLPDFQQWLTWTTELHVKTARQMVVWQVPVGNQYFETMNQTPGHYQDNRAEYFLSHISALQAAGIVAVLFGSGGNDNSTAYTDFKGDGITNPPPISTFECNLCNSHVSVWSDDDGGYLRVFMGAYYATTPTVSSLAPTGGPTAGGTSVTITGTNFTGVTAVKFGPATASFIVSSATQIAATSPLGTGIVNVTVTTAGGTSPVSSANQFTYSGPPPPTPTVTSVAPASGPAAGGTPVTITGTNFAGATAVAFGGTAAATFSVTDATHISATSPSGSGLVDVKVTTAGGTSATGAADQFTYISRPTVTLVAPTTGPAAGGTPITITGTNLTGATAVNFGGTAAATFLVNSATSIAATSPAGVGTVHVTVTTPGGTSASSGADQFTFQAPSGVYTAMAPTRLLDTRVTGQRLGPGGHVDLSIGGTHGVPSNATAVILNVTAVGESTAGFFTVYPTGGALPTASNLNWVAGETVPNLVAVGLGTAGNVRIFNGLGSADAVVDLQGYFAPSGGGTAGQFVAVVPARITDTRPGSGQANAGMKLGPGATLNVQVTGVGPIPGSGVSAVVLNVTATGTTSAGFFTVFPWGTLLPVASNLNWTAGVTVPNRVIVPVGSNGQVSFFNGLGSADVVIDVNGYFTTTALAGAVFTPLFPARILDTRFGSPLGAGLANKLVLQVGGNGGVPSNAGAVILNVTVARPTTASDLVIWPDLASMPVASDLNFVGGQTVPNLVIVKLSAGGKIDIFNPFGTTDVIVDVVGWFG